MSDNIHYRLGVIDDFRSTFAFVSYNRWGTMELTEVGRSHTAYRGYARVDDAIHVFLNYQKMGIYTKRDLANRAITILLKSAPVDLSQEAAVFSK